MLKSKRIKENILAILSFLFIWIFFFVELLQGGIATHDELLSIAYCIEGRMKFNLTVARWGMEVVHYPLNLIQNSMPSYMLYRLWTIIGLMIACLSVMIVIYRHIDRKLCWIFPIVFVLLAQIELEHDGLLAFCWGYQLDIALIFISIDFFITYKKKEKKKYKILSAAAYLVAIMAYEAFAAFGALLLLLDIIYMNDKRSIKIRELVHDLWLHFFCAFFYTVSFVILSRFYYAGDAVIGNKTSVMGFWQTLISYSIGLFPLRYFPDKYDEYGQLLKLVFDISWKNISLWAIIIFFAKMVINYLRKSKEISLKRYIAYSTLCLSGIILPNVVISLTSKFQQYTLLGIKTFGTSYYSYFFLVLWIVVTVAFAYNKTRSKNGFIVAVFVVLVCIARFTLISNDYYLAELKKNQHRYEAFWDIINSEYFNGLPENTQIYTDAYGGIHFDINTLSELATSVSKRQISVLNDKTQIDWNMPVYYLDYSPEIKGTYLFKMTDESAASEVYVHARNSLENYYCLFNILADEALPVYVDGRTVGAYRGNAVMPTLYTEMDNALLQCDRVNAEKFTVRLGYSEWDSSVIFFDGAYDLEEWGRWSPQNWFFVIDNVNNEEYCEVNALLGVGIHENTKLNIEYNGGKLQYEIPADGMELRISVPLTSGVNRIKFNSEAEDLNVPEDNRNLNIQIIRFDVNYSEKVYKYSL